MPELDDATALNHRRAGSFGRTMAEALLQTTSADPHPGPTMRSRVIFAIPGDSRIRSAL